MDEHIIVLGHGEVDPGAGGNGTNERDWLRNKLQPVIKKYARQLKKTKITIYDPKKNMYYETQRGRGAYTISTSVKSVTELHLDSATPAATGGHVIINSKYKPDSIDKALAAVVKKYAGWHASKKDGFSGRNDLLNCNVFANRGISYRLIELGFITSKKDMDVLNKSLDSLGKDLVQAISGEKLGASSKPTPKPKPAPAKPTTQAPKPTPAPKYKTITTWAVETENGAHGNGDARRKKLGNKYNSIMALINQRAGLINRTEMVKTIANEVKKGVWGNGSVRKGQLGELYTDVQNRVNRG